MIDWLSESSGFNLDEAFVNAWRIGGYLSPLDSIHDFSFLLKIGRFFFFWVNKNFIAQTQQNNTPEA